MAYVREQRLGQYAEAAGAAVAVLPQVLNLFGRPKKKKRAPPPAYFPPPAAAPAQFVPPAGGPFGLPGWVLPAVVIGGLGLGAFVLLRPARAPAPAPAGFA